MYIASQFHVSTVLTPEKKTLVTTGREVWVLSNTDLDTLEKNISSTAGNSTLIPTQHSVTCLIVMLKQLFRLHGQMVLCLGN